MSRFWPHTPYAEDQPFPHLILTTHIFTRALTTGAIIGPAIGTPLHLLRQLNILKTKPTSLPPSFISMLLRSSATGAVITMGVMVFATPARMWGREEIEWQDRSWRLLENRGQVECDDWTYAGMAAGAVASLRTRGWRGKVGCVGIGSVVGTLGYMGWRYGVKGGKFEETNL